MSRQLASTDSGSWLTARNFTCNLFRSAGHFQGVAAVVSLLRAFSFTTMRVWLALVLLASTQHLASSQLTSVQRDNILSVHNALRGEVYPRAADMQELRWDADLAAIAQAHTSRCQWMPNHQANTSASNLYPEGVGENLAFRVRSNTGDKVQPARFVHEWFVESSFYNYSTNQCAERETCDHYKQIVASGTTAIGCGFNTCRSFNFFSVDLPNASFFACVYGPIGMPFSERPYTEGASCSACPAHLTSCTNKLCTTTTNTTTTTNGTTSITARNTTAPSTNLTAPPLLTMPPTGFDVITDIYTTAEPIIIPTLLPTRCNTPATPNLRETCWREAWLLWTKKYNQWAAGECTGQRTTPQTVTGLVG